MNTIVFPSAPSVINAILALVGEDGAKLAVDAARAAIGNEFANEKRDKTADSSGVKLGIAAANKTRGETATIRLADTRIAKLPSNRPLRLWYLAQSIEALGKLNLAPESLKLPVDLEAWVSLTFAPKPSPSGKGKRNGTPHSNGNGTPAKRGMTPAPSTK